MSGDKQSRQEAGQFIMGKDEYSGTGEVAGDFTFEIDGKPYKVTYTAREGGFQAQGAHFPTPVPDPYRIS